MAALTLPFTLPTVPPPRTLTTLYGSSKLFSSAVSVPKRNQTKRNTTLNDYTRDIEKLGYTYTVDRTALEGETRTVP